MSAPIPGTGQRTIRVGMTPAGYKVRLELELRNKAGEQGDGGPVYETTDHRVITGYVELAMQTTVSERGRFIGGGQDRESLREAALGDLDELTAEQAVELADLWDNYHLNGLKAACVHQQAEADRIFSAMPGYSNSDARWAELSQLPCPEGYSYGTKWLVEPLPIKVADRVADFITGKALEPAESNTEEVRA